MARELPYIAAIDEAIHLEMERDERVLYFGQNMAQRPRTSRSSTPSARTACA